MADHLQRRHPAHAVAAQAIAAGEIRNEMISDHAGIARFDPLLQPCQCPSRGVLRRRPRTADQRPSRDQPAASLPSPASGKDAESAASVCADRGHKAKLARCRWAYGHAAICLASF
jgi:hypothetical protein